MAMIRKVLWTSFLRLRGLRPFLHELKRFRELAGEDARYELGKRLLAQLKYFGQRPDALPEWREAAKIRDVERLWEIWPTLPVVTKRDLQTHFSAERLRQQVGVDGAVSATGGSTGEPTSFLHDAPMLAATTASRYFVRRQMGWRPGMATICLWGSERDIGHQRTLRNRISCWLRNDWMVEGYGLDARTTDNVLSYLACHRSAAMYGFTTMMEFVARSVLERNVDVKGRVTAAWNGGEMLYPHQQSLFQQAFGVPLRNYYGSRELGPVACQLDSSRGLWVLQPWIYVEIVDDRNRPLPPGQSGRLLVTSTVCRGTPLLRYEIGDLGSSDPTDHEVCGVRIIRELAGRSAGLIKLPSGRAVNCLFWNHLFKELPEVQQFQVVVRSPCDFLLRLRGRPWDSSREDQVRTLLRRLLGPVPVGVQWVDEIPRTPQGKLMQVIRED